MHTFTRSLFSIRNAFFIVVVVLTARSTADSISSFEIFPNSNQESPDIIVLEDFQPGIGGNSSLDAILLPTTSDVASNLLGSDSFFLLSSGPEVNARTWLSHLAPPNESFDLIIQNSINTLQSLITNSNAPFENTLSPFSPSSANSVADPTSYVVFLGIDLADSESPDLEVPGPSNNTTTSFIFSDFTSPSAASIPEPSSALLLLFAFAKTLSRRKR